MKYSLIFILFIINFNRNKYDYVIDGYTNERFTIEGYQGKFLMN